MWRTAAALTVFALGLGWPLRLWAAEPGAEEAVQQLRSDSQAQYVHRITLYDHEGVAIDPTDEFAGPYSPRMTCAKCHDYGAISGGWHFNAGRDTVAGGRPGEPWILVDPQTGTQLAVCGRGWPGTFTLDEARLTDWQFVLRFGAHTPGGGYGEPSAEAVESSPEAARWNISGPLEIDCMFCHSADQQHDPAEAARQIERQNFKWAPTVALGLATVRGAAKDLPDDWDPLMPANPNLPEQGGPELIWDTRRFDADDRVFFNIVRQPPNERCYFCHSVRQVGPDAPPEWLATADVHLVAGLKCVDCHRNGIDHMMTRGYATEAAERGQPALAGYSCEGCHLGAAGSADPVIALGGRYGAPHPQHRGLPPLHFDKLTCTACHSGPWPQMDPKRFQTAMAHRLGLATRERDETDWPQILGPIFARQTNGEIAPERMIWPALWGIMSQGEIRPLPLDVAKRAAELLPRRPPADHADALAAPGTFDFLPLLGFLRDHCEEPGELVYVVEGWGYREADHKGASGSQHPAGAPYLWPIAHDVRPAAQALGVRGCTDCHATDAPIYFGRTWAASEPRPHTTFFFMHEVRAEHRLLAELWGHAFRARSFFKWFAFICAGLIVLAALRLALVPGAGRPAAPDATRRGATRLHTLLLLVGAAGLAINAVSGFGPEWVFGEVAGWALFVHMLGAPLFVVGLTGLTLLQSAGRGFGAAASVSRSVPPVRQILLWILLLAGLSTMASMLTAMVPVFGYAEQDVLISVHEISALVLVITVVLYVLDWIRTRRAEKVNPS